MTELELNYFSIAQISESGQCFRLNQIEENRFSLIALGTYLEIEQRDGKTIFYCTPEEFQKVWFSYFDLAEDYARFQEPVQPEDEYLSQAIRFGSGIRILVQDLWETLISFIISQQNNIRRIKKSIELLSERFGDRKESDRGVYYTFPELHALAEATEEDLRDCNLGYRSRYLVNTVNCLLHNEVDLKALKCMDYKASKQELMKLCGIGTKVADCICLFALHHLDAFPVDTHINKILKTYYPNGFPIEKFSGYAGVIQQYLFYYDIRKNKL